MSKEIRLGLLAIATIAALIWGYKFLLGKNILNRSNTYFIEYENIDQLSVSDPVLISGFQVGTVQNIQLKPDDLKTIVVTIDVQRNIQLPQNTTAELRSEGVMGGKAIILAYDGTCSNDCTPSGSYLKGQSFSLLESMVPSSEIDTYVDILKGGVTGVFDTLSDRLSQDDPDEVAATAQSFASTIRNLEKATASMDYLFRSSTGKLVSLLENLDAITSSLRANSSEINGMITNMNAITNQLKDSHLDSTVLYANQAIASSGKAIENLESTLEKSQKTIAELTSLLEGVNKGEGTLGSLAKNKELYDNLNKASKELDLLLQDFRLNPKRYIGGFLGKKQKPYVAPKEDPAQTTTKPAQSSN